MADVTSTLWITTGTTPAPASPTPTSGQTTPPTNAPPAVQLQSNGASAEALAAEVAPYVPAGFSLSSAQSVVPSADSTSTFAAQLLEYQTATSTQILRITRETLLNPVSLSQLTSSGDATLATLSTGSQLVTTTGSFGTFSQVMLARRDGTFFILSAIRTSPTQQSSDLTATTLQTLAGNLDSDTFDLVASS